MPSFRHQFGILTLSREDVDPKSSPNILIETAAGADESYPRAADKPSGHVKPSVLGQAKDVVDGHPRARATSPTSLPANGIHTPLGKLSSAGRYSWFHTFALGTTQGSNGTARLVIHGVLSCLLHTWMSARSYLFLVICRHEQELKTFIALNRENEEL